MSHLVGHLVQAALMPIALSPVRLYLLDAKPIPVCKAIRHGRVRLLREEGADVGKTSAGWFVAEPSFFGFKLHLITHATGAVISAMLTPGNWDDRPAALALVWSRGGSGSVIADAGYRGKEVFDLLSEEARAWLVRPRDAAWGSPTQQVLSAGRERVGDDGDEVPMTRPDGIAVDALGFDFSAAPPLDGVVETEDEQATAVEGAHEYVQEGLGHAASRPVGTAEHAVIVLERAQAVQPHHAQHMGNGVPSRSEDHADQEHLHVLENALVEQRLKSYHDRSKLGRHGKRVITLASDTRLP